MNKPEKETLTVEFKSDLRCLPLDDLYKELVAMANTDGGIVCLGVEDSGKATGVQPQHANPEEMAAKIQTHTVPPLASHVFTEHWDGVDVLVIEVKPSMHLVMTSDGRYLRRRIMQKGQPEIIAMTPAEIVQRLSSIQVVDPSVMVIEDVPASEALNPLERIRLRGMVRSFHGDAALLDLTDEELDKALDLVKQRDGVYYPTMAGLLLLGYEQYIREYVPGNEVLFQVMDGTNVLYNPPAMRGSLLSIFENVNLLFESRITEQEIQIGLFRVPIPNYEREAFREGFVNALVHRDYFRLGSVLIQLQLSNQSMVIASPGGFPEGVTSDNILTVAPTQRNRILAEAIKRIGLAERTGRGVDKIYRSMLRSGHEIPDYSDSNSTMVILRLNSAELDEAFIRMLVTEEKRLNDMLPVDTLIVLATLKKERRATIPELAKRVQKSESDTRNTVEALVELGMIEGVGNGKARYYMLSSKVYSISGKETSYTRQKGMTTIQEKNLIERHVSQFGTITRVQTVELCKCTDAHASYLLRKMIKDGILIAVGNGKNTRYRKND